MLATVFATYIGYVSGSTGSLNQALILESTWLQTQTAGNLTEVRCLGARVVDAL